MANPGLSTTIDVDALTGIIVFCNSYKQLVDSNAAQIKALCKSMETEESLVGGDGDVIRTNFARIAEGCVNLENSTAQITKVMNEKLERAIDMRHGKTVGDTTDAANKAAANMGVLKKE